jgi:hypothetical protein
MKRAVRTFVLVVAVACAFASAATVRIHTNLGPPPLCPDGGWDCGDK